MMEVKLNLEGLAGVVTEYSTGRKFIKKQPPARKRVVSAAEKLHLGMGDTARALYNVFQTPWAKAYYLYVLSEGNDAPEVRKAGVEMSLGIQKNTLDKKHGRQVGSWLTKFYQEGLTDSDVLLHLMDVMLDGEHKEAVLLLAKASIQLRGMKLKDFLGMFPMGVQDREYLEDAAHYLAENA